MANLKENNGAKFSDCGKHRLLLWRIWDDSKPLIMFIGLNPSTANAKEDDNTIRRVKSIAEYNGYGGIYMTNLFTFISTDPKKLNIYQGNIFDSDFYLKTTAEASNCIVAAWGNFKVFGRDIQIKRMFPEMVALKINKNGSPKHPLYCRTDSKFVNFDEPIRLPA